MNKNVKKVPAADTVLCKYRGKWVECSKRDVADGMCAICGWNPAIESERKAAIKNEQGRDG